MDNDRPQGGLSSLFGTKSVSAARYLATGGNPTQLGAAGVVGAAGATAGKTGGPTTSPIAGNEQQLGYCARFKDSIAQPELMQPTILAISLTYIVYTISVNLSLLSEMQAAVQFTYYCCILGLLSSVVLYSRFICAESKQSTASLIYIAILVLIVAFYMGHWFVKPTFGGPPLDPDTGLYGADPPSSGGPSRRPTRPPTIRIPQRDHLGGRRPDHRNRPGGAQAGKTPEISLEGCIDKRKCSHPLHLVLQIAFMFCVLQSLVASLLWLWLH